MLTEIRNRFTNTVGLVIIGVIAVTFVLVGPTMSFTGQAYYARVNGISVQPAEVEQAYQRQAEDFRRQVGSIPPALDQRIRAQAQEQVITEKVMQSYLEENRIVAAKDSIVDAIRSNPTFQDGDRFSNELYRQTLAGVGMMPERYEQQIGQTLARGQLRDGISATSFVTPGELRRYIELTRERRQIMYAVFALDAWQSDDDPAAERIQTYFDENSDRFQTEATAELAYIELSVDELAASIDVSDSAISDYFDGISEDYRTDPERNPRHILITIDDGDEAAAETLAQSLTERALAGEDFAALATEFSKDGGSASQGGDLGWVRPGQFVPSVDEAVFAMAIDEIRGPIRSDFGYHVVRLDAIRDGGIPPLADVRAEVESDYRNAEAEQLFTDKNAQLGDELFDNPVLEDLAATLGVDVKVIDDFTRASGALFLNSPDVIASVFGDVPVRGAALSEPIEYQEGRVIVLRVNEFSPPATRPLADVREQIVATLKAGDAAAARATALGELLATSRNDATVFVDAAAELGGEVFEAVTLERNQVGAFPGDLVDTVFEQRAPEVNRTAFGRANGSGDDAIVFALQTVSPGDPATLGAAERDALRQQLAQRGGISDLAAFILALREEAKVTFGSLASVPGESDL
ncbi:MAG: SurA N-terminal domain-containing protein [Pseudomonadota bacterium]